MTAIDSGRLVRRFTQQIFAAPDRVFPLLCPVREAEWLEGWGETLEMIHSASGLAEEGCVFRTRTAGQPETVWLITRHDATSRVVEFVRVTIGLAATRLTVQVAEGPDATSRVEISYTLTPLSPDGRELLAEHFSDEAFRRSMVWWQDSMNQWLRTGRLLRAEAS